MDKAKAMELANKILNANKKDASFFDFINEQFQDDSAIVSFIEQIDFDYLEIQVIEEDDE